MYFKAYFIAYFHRLRRYTIDDLAALQRLTRGTPAVAHHTAVRRRGRGTREQSAARAHCQVRYPM